MRLFLGLLLTGCTDYHLLGGGKEAGHEPLPILRYEPVGINLGEICSEELTEVFLFNDGDAPLIIDTIAVNGDGWQLGSDPTPLEIAPSGSYVLHLTTGIGEANLIIRSNDPDREVSTVPLASYQDSPPTIVIESPSDGTILTEGTVLDARVVDDVDLSENLLVQWQSDLDGLFSVSPPAPDGSLVVEWENHSSGNHVVELLVSDSCENTAIESITVCQQQSYDVESFDISSWHFEGAANWDATNEWVELTPNAENLVGSAFSIAQSVMGDQVEIEFQFFIGGGTGADGISLTALDIDRMTTYLGGTGCGIGYGNSTLLIGLDNCTLGPALPGWSLEVDTHFNDGQDISSENHLMLTFDGDVDNGAIQVDLPTMEDGVWHQMKVLINAPHVFVEIDGVTYIDQDVNGNYNFLAYIGFTAGTGGQTNFHLIDSLVVTEQICE